MLLCSKKIDDGPINMARSKKKKKSCDCTYELININHLDKVKEN